MADTDFKKLTIHSSFDEIEQLESFLNDLQTWAHFDEEQYSNIKLAVNEAVTNAVMHGNKEDASKVVHVTASLNDTGLQISVQDEGSGFDPSTLPDPLQQENLLNQSGRGLFLIKQCSDKLEFENDASKLIMHFSLNS